MNRIMIYQNFRTQEKLTNSYHLETKKEYLKRKNIPGRRVMFRVRTKMIAFKENMKNMSGTDKLQFDESLKHFIGVPMI